MKTPPRGTGPGSRSGSIDRNNGIGKSTSNKPDDINTLRSTPGDAMKPDNPIDDVFILREQARTLQQSISPKTSEEQRKVQYFSRWEHCAAANSNDGADRAAAVHRFTAALQSHRPKLALSLAT